MTRLRMYVNVGALTVMGLIIFAAGALIPMVLAQGTTISACVNRSSGGIKIVASGASCPANSDLYTWNQAGPQGPAGPPGPQGSEGPQGPPGAGGASAAFSVQSPNEVNIPPFFTTILEMNVPAGDYVVTGGVVVHNFSFPSETLAVNCVLGSPTEFSLNYSARIDPFNSATAQGASTIPIPLSLATHLAFPGTLTLQCQTNNLSQQMAIAGSRHLTAVMVGSVSASEN
jgi:hypothetical protein